MLLSMTGYGEARAETGGVSVSVEIRAVNNRYLKVNLRCPEPYHALEAEIEKAIRKQVKRGTLQVQLNIRRQPRPEDYQLNVFALRTLMQQVRVLEAEFGGALTPIGSILALPGVVAEPQTDGSAPQEEWAFLEPVFQSALSKLQAMRQEEGKAMAAELQAHTREIAAALEQVRSRTPKVVEGYHERLREKICQLLREQGIEPDPAQLLREVALFAERTDVNEELVRLASHLEQLSDTLRERESPGRKLDFLIQEMVREVNTIGSKGNDVEIARHVVAMKATIEKMRELVQNVE